MKDALPFGRKPRIAIMGEFSAGKSTLSNLLLGRRALPEKVTATRLPPVWICAGDAPPHRVTTDGAVHPVEIDRLEDVPLDETLYIKLAFHAEILDQCDLIDFPGISDPNMASEVWERMLGEVDGVLWCTHATQAWRQSEAAVWERIPRSVRFNSLLLITRFDKLTTDNDKARVRARLARETAGLFADTCPISLTQAIDAADATQWAVSGAEAFSAALMQIVARAARTVPSTDDRSAAQDDAPAVEAPVMQAAPLRQPLILAAAPDRPTTASMEELPRRIVPRRVKPAGPPQTPRPSRADAGGEPARVQVLDQPDRPTAEGATDLIRRLFR